MESNCLENLDTQHLIIFMANFLDRNMYFSVGTELTEITDRAQFSAFEWACCKYVLRIWWRRRLRHPIIQAEPLNASEQAGGRG